MSKKHIVDCIVERKHKNPHERIQSIGGETVLGKRWQFSESEAIERIDQGEQFFVVVDKNPVRVIIAVRKGRRYLKTKQDTDKKNNLLQLPPCPRQIRLVP